MLSKIERNLGYFFNGNGKALILAYDQGMEHGPTDFNEINVDPDFILNLAATGNFTGLIFQKGLAEKYYYNYRGKSKIPLLIKLNGKTDIIKGEPYSPQVCSVKEAVLYGAKAVGYTIYLGSEHESKIFKEFGEIKREAMQYGLPTVIWMYPRGSAIKNDMKGDLLAYGARVALELGADMVKMKYNSKPEDLKWMVKCAGRCKLVVAGGSRTTPQKILKEADEIMKAGASGLAIGRNIWQSQHPEMIADALSAIVLKNASLDAALNYIEQKMAVEGKK